MNQPDCVWLFFVFLYNLAVTWQTLIAALIALYAAWWAGKIAAGQLEAARAQIEVARDQIAEAKAQADRERFAKLRAARASLPTTLSAICNYARSSGEVLYSAWPAAARLYPDQHDGGVDQRITADVPPFPYEVLESLERVIELTDVEEVAERMESILREAQIFTARTLPLVDGVSIPTDLLEDHIIQAAALYARAESLFTYARRKTPGVNSANLWDRTIVALSIMKVYQTSILRKAHARKAAGDPPGEADSEEPE